MARPRKSARSGNELRFGQSCERNTQYDTEQVEWMLSMDRLRRKLGRMPTWAEVLEEAGRLGYRRIMPA